MFGAIFFGTVATFFTAAGVRSLTHGEYPSAVAAFAFAVGVIGWLTPLPKTIRLNMLPRCTFDDSDMTIRPDRTIDLPIIVAVTASTLAAVLIAVLAPLGRLDIPMSPTSRYSIPFSASVLAALGLPHVCTMLKRGTTKYLRLSPIGFEIAEGLRPQIGEWCHVVDVTNARPDGRKTTPGAIVFVMSDGTSPTMAGASFTPDGTALRDLARYYWQHPDDRAELTDGRAAQRLKDLINA